MDSGNLKGLLHIGIHFFQRIFLYKLNLTGSKMSSICNLMNLLKCFKILSILILISLFIREMAIRLVEKKFHSNLDF